MNDSSNIYSLYLYFTLKNNIKTYTRHEISFKKTSTLVYFEGNHGKLIT